MDLINLTLAVVLVLFASWGGMDMGCQATNIDIIPDKFMTGTDTTTHISCATDDLPDGAQQVMLIQIYKAGEQPIAFLHPGSNLVKADDVGDDIEVTGTIGNGQARSYLNVTLTTPTTEDSGTYTCTVYYLTDSGVLREDSASGKLIVEKLDVFTLETILQSMKKQIDSLEERCNGKITGHRVKEEETDLSYVDKMKLMEEEKQKLSQRIDELANADKIVMEMFESLSKNANKVVTQAIKDMMGKVELAGQEQMKVLGSQTKAFSQQVEELTNRVTFVSAFSATNLERFAPVKGKVLVFPDVTMQQGQGYDPKTGIFTAPRAGVYYFNLLVLIRSKRNFLDVYLMVNTTRVASMGVGDDFYNDQSSMGAVVQLTVGDKVNLVVANLSPTGFTINDKNFSQFSGFLVKEL